jgi:MSHA biogenesis protein MshO
MKTRGFTLVEMVMVIVILGIISAVVGIFIKPAIESYFDTQRRGALTDLADTALRRIGRDVRSAVPNSIRTPSSTCFELVPTSTGGRYRVAPDTVNGGSDPLDTTQANTAFDVLSPMSTTPAAGDYVVIDNQNTDDVYNGVNRAAIASISTPAATAGLKRITLSSASYFPDGYQAGRFVVVPNNGGNQTVFYICSNCTGTDAQGNGTGTLYRLTRAFTPAYPAACPATAGAAIVATNVSASAFTYNANQGGSQQSGFVWMQLTLSQVHESASLSYGVHVDNVP